MKTAKDLASPFYASGRDIPNVSGSNTGSESILREAKERANAAWEHDRENREDGFLDLRFLAADQWPESIRLERENAGRPVITINRLPQFLFQVANDIRINPPGIKITPAGGRGDEEIAEIYSGLIRSIERASNGPNIYATAGMHAVACGQGHWRVATRYVDDDVFEQEIVLEGIKHPFAVLWDPEAQCPDRSDGKWCQVTQLIHRDNFSTEYPGASAASYDIPIPGQDPEQGMFWRNGDWIRVVEYWRKIAVKKKIALFESGLVTDITKLSRGEMEQLVMSNGQVQREREADGMAVESTLLSGVDILEQTTRWPGRHIPIITTIGGEIPLDTKVVRFGIVRFARDAQQLYNYARSAAAESIGLAPKSPYLLTSKMIARYKAMWDTHNTTQRPYLCYDPDPEAPHGPQRLHPPEMPQAFVQEQQIAVEDMKATTGVYDASLGARSNETSGIAIQRREEQGDTATAHFAANLTSSLVHCGRVIVDLAPHIYDTQRVVKIIKDDEETEEDVQINQVVFSDRGEQVLINDLSHGKYDVTPRRGPSYSTKRIEAVNSMLQFAQAVPQAAAIIGDLIAKNMDWPGADEMAKRLKRALPPHIAGPDEDEEDGEKTPMQQQMEQQAAKQAETEAKRAELELIDMESKIEERLGKMAESEAKAEKTRAETAETDINTISKKLDVLIGVLQANMQGIPVPPSALTVPKRTQQQKPPQMPQGGPGGGETMGQPPMPGGEQMPPMGAQPGLAGGDEFGGDDMDPEALAQFQAGFPDGGLDAFLGGDEGAGQF